MIILKIIFTIINLIFMYGAMTISTDRKTDVVFNVLFMLILMMNLYYTWF